MKSILTVVLICFAALSYAQLPSKNRALLQQDSSLVKNVGPKNQPLYLVDDKEISTTNVLNSVSPTAIQWMDVFKEPAQISAYGPKGVNGVVKIYTNAYVAQEVEIKLKTASEAYKQYRVHNPNTRVIYMLNNDVLPDNKEVFRLAPSRIEKIEINQSGSVPTVKITAKS
jgi:hypothetical protein